MGDGHSELDAQPKMSGSQTALSRPAADRDPHDWQLVDEASVSQCGSSPRSVSCEEYVSDLGELLEDSLPENVCEGNFDSTSERTVAVAGSPPLLLESDDLPLSVHHAPLMSGSETSPTSSAVMSVPSSVHSSVEIMKEGGHCPEAIFASAEIASSPSITDSGPESNVETCEPEDTVPAQEGSPSSLESDHMLSKLDRETEELPHPPSDSAARCLENSAFKKKEGVPANTLSPFEPDHSKLAATGSPRVLCIIEHLWDALKAYVKAVGAARPPSQLQETLATISKHLRLSGKHRLADSTLVLASGLVSVSALLLWSMLRNRSLSRQLLRSQMDMEHHVTTILSLNDRLARGLQLPITHHCSYTSGMRGLPSTSQLISLSGSFF